MINALLHGWATPPRPLVNSAGDRTMANGAVAYSLGVQSCFWVFNRDHSWQVSLLGAGMPSQNGFPKFWTPLKFHNLLPRSQSSYKGTFAHLWLPSYCCWGEISMRSSFSSILLTSSIFLSCHFVFYLFSSKKRKENCFNFFPFSFLLSRWPR